MNRDDYWNILMENGYKENIAYIAANAVANQTDKDLTFEEIENVLYPFSIELIKEELGGMSQAEVEEILEDDDYHEYVSLGEMSKLINTYLNNLFKKMKDNRELYYQIKERVINFRRTLIKSS